MALEVKTPNREVHRAVDSSPRWAKELRGALSGMQARLLKLELDRWEAVVVSDRQFEIIKRQVMDAFGETDRMIRAAITQVAYKEENRTNGTTDSDDRS